MPDRWFDPLAFQTEDGRWAASIDCHVDTGTGIATFRLHDSGGNRFPTQAQALIFSADMGKRWLAGEDIEL